MLKKMLVVVAMSTVAVTAFANDYARREAKQVVELKDGSTVYVFDGGKMAMESKFGRAVRMDPGVVMETKDGQKITMVGDEVARLSTLLWQDYRSSK
jgi:ketosteroid isomerase-like protein